jgi:hypothetical protein
MGALRKVGGSFHHQIHLGLLHICYQLIVQKKLRIAVVRYWQPCDFDV